MASTGRGWLAVIALSVLACGTEKRHRPSPAADAEVLSDDFSDSQGGDPGETPTTLWLVRTRVAATVFAPDISTCLAPTAQTIAEGTQLEALAADANFVLIDAEGSCLRRVDLEELNRPEPLPAATSRGVVQNGTNRYTYAINGCPVKGEELAELGEVDVWARSLGRNYNGFLVIDRSLGLAPLRMIDANDWVYPWDASVQLVKEVPEGFVIGGGVLVGPNIVLTAAHMNVDSGFCYSRAPNTGRAWEQGTQVCGNIEAPFEVHPAGVDVAVVHLTNPEPPPYATLRTTALSAGEAFYSSRLSTLHTHAFADSSVAEVGNRNAFCADWPADTSFMTADTIVGGGDSGGPVFVGDEVVGLVHGEACKRWPWDSTRQVFVHLPAVSDFLAPFLAPAP